MPSDSSIEQFAPPSVIDTPRLRMRSWDASDAPALHQVLVASDAHLRAWTPWVVDGRVPGMTLEQRLSRHADAFAQGQEWVYALFARSDGSILGACGLYPRIGVGALELGYWTAADAGRRGFATEAAKALTEVALGSPAVERVEIRCDPRNIASIRVAQRLGFRRADDVRDPHEPSHDLQVWWRDRDRT